MSEERKAAAAAGGLEGGMAAAPLAGAHGPSAVPADQALEPWAQEVQTARPVTGAHVCSYLNPRNAR